MEFTCTLYTKQWPYFSYNDRTMPESPQITVKPHDKYFGMMKITFLFQVCD